MISFFRYLKGYVRIRLSGYSPERFLNLCKAHHIEIWELQNTGTYYEMNLSIRDFRKLKPLRKKARARIQVIERHGLPFFLHQNRYRKMFPVGIVLCMVLLYTMSLYIWNIHIEGNYTRTTDVILDFLKSEQIVHGMKKSQVNCKEIQSLIRIEFPDIIWVSAEIKGTQLFIRVKENEDTFVVSEEADHEMPRNIVADKSGIITSVLIRNGVSQTQVGEEVEEGTTLVSGRIDILNDSGEISGYQYTAADADIYARTTYTYEDEFLLSHEEQIATGRDHYSLYVTLGNHTLHLGWKPNYKTCHILNTDYPLKLTENFYLPVTFGVRKYEEYEIYTENYTKEEAKLLAEQGFHDFLENLMQKGVQIVENSVKIEVGRNTCKVSGDLIALEEISRYVPTEILEEPLSEEDTKE